MQLKTRIWSIIGLTLVLLGIIIFLLQTSKNVEWGGGFWEQWLIAHLHWRPSTAHLVVFWSRKSVHFTAYGSLTLLFWLYFHLWGLRRAAGGGLIGTALVASLDEYMQSLSTFRTGLPTDVLIDVSGGAVFTLVLYGWLQWRNKRWLKER